MKQAQNVREEETRWEQGTKISSINAFFICQNIHVTAQVIRFFKNQKVDICIHILSETKINNNTLSRSFAINAEKIYLICLL